MKNEEKAKEFADYYADETDYKKEAAYSAAVAMAEWKDQQFQKVLDYAEICYGVFTFQERCKFINKIKEIYFEK